MRKRVFLLGIISFISFYCHAQVGLIEDCAYFFTFRPVVGSMNTSSDISHGVNSKLDLKSKGVYYGTDLLNATWTYVEGAYLVPKIQIPIRIRYMQTDDGLKISDGTKLSNSDKLTFFNLDLGLNIQYSHIYFRWGNVLVSPKIGIGFDWTKHNYNIDISKFIGKDGTNPALQNQVNAIAPANAIYSVNFWEDLYGFNVGAYINLGTSFILEGAWEYYPIRFIVKNTGLSMYDDFGGDGYMESTLASMAKLNRWNIELRWNILTNVAAFAKYESSYYKYGVEGGISTGGGVLLDREVFEQWDNSLVFGVAVVFAQ